MTRPLVWMAAFFSAAAMLLVYVPAAVGYLAAAACAAAPLCLLRLLPAGARRRMAAACGAVLLACLAVWGFGWRAGRLSPLAGRQAPVRMTVLEYQEKTGYCLLTLYGQAELDGRRHTLTVQAVLRDTPGWQVGDQVGGSLSFAQPDGWEETRLLYSRGRFLTARADSLEPLPAGTRLPGGPRVWGAKLNHALSEGLLTALPGQNGAFVQSVLLGRREQLDEGVTAAMRRSGAAHILVVSGLHLSLICGGVMALLPARKSWRRPRCGVGMAACLVVMAAAGFTPSVTRGGIMMLITLGAGLLNRWLEPFSTLSAAVLLMGVANPYLFASWSFLLSVTAMLSLTVFGRPVGRWVHSWPWWGRLGRLAETGKPQGVIAVSLSASVYTYPMLSVMYGGLPAYGLLGNLLIAPLCGVMLASGALAAAAGAAGFSAAARLVALPAGALAAMIQQIAGFIAALPGSWQPIRRVWQMVWLAAAAAVCTLWAARSEGKGMTRIRPVSLALAAALLLSAGTAHLLDRGRVELTTPEGSGALLLLAGDQAVVVDADAAGAEALEHLGLQPVFYSFDPQTPPREAAMVLQEYPPRAAALGREAAGQAAPYLAGGVLLLDPSAPVELGPGFTLTFADGYTLIEMNGLRMLKLPPGYAIIETEAGLPAADVVIDGQGGIHAGSAVTRRLRLKPGG